MTGRLVELPIAIPQIGQERIMVDLARRYEKEPLLALKEYITNALDAVDAKKNKTENGKITVALDPYSRSLIVVDNADGMSQNYMNELSLKIGHSPKYGKIDQRGEKGVGLLAFGSLGNALHVVSREATLANVSYNYVNWTKEQVSGEERIKAYGSKFRKDEKEIIQDFYGAFRNGSMIVLNLTEDVFKEKLTSDDIVRFIQETYLPLLFNQRVAFNFAEVSRDKNRIAGLEERVIKTPEIVGDVFLEEKIDFVSMRAKKGSLPEKCELDVMLVFNGEDDTGKVGVYSKDVKVYDSITELDRDFKKDPFWSCGHIQGYVNEPLLRLTLGRDAFIQRNVADTHIYKDMKNVLMEISRKWWPKISEQIEKAKIQKSDERLDEVFALLEEAYQVGTPICVKRRITKPRDRGSDTADGSKPSESDKRDESDSEDEGDEDDDEPRRRRLPYHPRKLQFDKPEENLRSKCDVDLNGNRFIAINETHTDYVNIVRRGTIADERAYLLDVAIPRIPECEMLDGIEQRKPYSEKEIPTRVINRLEELKSGLNKTLNTPKARRITRRKKKK